MTLIIPFAHRPWNKGVLVGQKRPLQPKNVWSIRVRLEMSGVGRELALFNLAIDSKLRACDLVRLRVEDLCSGNSIRDRATIIQKKTNGPSSSKSLNRRSPRLRLGFRSFESWAENACFRAGPIEQIISLRASTLGSSIGGFLASAWTQRRTAPIP